MIWFDDCPEPNATPARYHIAGDEAFPPHPVQPVVGALAGAVRGDGRAVGAELYRARYLL